jgi:hypothetical protein
MRVLGRRLAVAATALLVTAVQVVGAGASGSQQEATMVKQLVKAANHHQLAATLRLFAASAVLRVSKQELHGQSAVKTWWRTEFAHSLHISLKSSVQTGSRTAGAVLRRTTKGGDCPKGCLERASWQFSGLQFTGMSLTRLTSPTRPAPAPSIPKTVPPPPKGTPRPNVTPTVPS